jgi:hypothetical protein
MTADDDRTIDRVEAARLAAEAVGGVERPLRMARAVIAARLRDEQSLPPSEDESWHLGYQEGLQFAIDAIDDGGTNSA